MKLFISACLLLLSLNVFAREGRIVAVYFDGFRSEFALTVQHTQIRNNSIRAKDFYLVSSDIPECKSLCRARVRALVFRRFQVYVNDEIVS